MRRAWPVPLCAAVIKPRGKSMNAISGLLDWNVMALNRRVRTSHSQRYQKVTAAPKRKTRRDRG